MEFFVNGAVAGWLEAGAYLLFCALFLLPFIVLEKRARLSEFSVWLEFLGGRLLAFTLFVLVMFFSNASSAGPFPRPFKGALLLLSGFLLGFYGIAKFFKAVPALGRIESSRALKYFPFLTGFVLGFYIINTPGVTAMLQLLPSKSAYASFPYLSGYFIVTGLSLIPLLFARYLSKMNNTHIVEQVFGAFAVFGGLYFFILGILLFVK